jgi:hypothetical protein
VDRSVNCSIVDSLNWFLKELDLMTLNDWSHYILQLRRWKNSVQLIQWMKILIQWIQLTQLWKMLART